MMVFLDILLFIMIIICIVYCLGLNRRIQELQNSKIEFARMIKDLNISIVKAEINIEEMSKLGKITSTEIDNIVGKANETSSELTSITQIATDISNSLKQQIKNFHHIISQKNNPTSSNNEEFTTSQNDKFSDEDFAQNLEKENNSYTKNLKNFIHNIVTKKSGNNSNQINYYDTLRRIRTKK